MSCSTSQIEGAGGIEIQRPIRVQIEHCCAFDCRAESSGGFIEGWTNDNLMNVIIQGVSAASCVSPKYYGGGICFVGKNFKLGDPPININDANFTTCSSKLYGSSIMMHTTNTVIRRVITSANSGTYGISMYWEPLIMNLTDCICVNASNQISVCIVRNGPTINIQSCLFFNVIGPQVYSGPGTIRVKNCGFSANSFPSSSNVIDDGGNYYGIVISIIPKTQCSRHWSIPSGIPDQPCPTQSHSPVITPKPSKTPTLSSNFQHSRFFVPTSFLTRSLKFIQSDDRKQTNSYVSSLTPIATHPLMFSEDLISFQALEKSFHFIPSTIVPQSHRQFNSPHFLPVSDSFTSSINVPLSSSFAVSHLLIISFVSDHASQFCHDSIPWNDSMVFQNVDSQNFRDSDSDLNSSIHLNETVGCDISIALFMTQSVENSKSSSASQGGRLPTVFHHSASYASSHSGDNANAELGGATSSLGIVLGTIFASLFCLASGIMAIVIYRRHLRMQESDGMEEADGICLPMDSNNVLADPDSGLATGSNALSDSGTSTTTSADDLSMDTLCDAFPASEIG
jgi:hypothetical protein